MDEKMDETMIQKALEIAILAHEGQRDKAGKPYLLHPIIVATEMLTDDEIIVALLHDVIEDSDYTIEDLEGAGFSAPVIEAVQLLTHKQGVSYDEYIEGISKNKLATKVKMADLTHNADLSRLPAVTEQDLNRQKKYKKAFDFLLSVNFCYQ